MGNFVATLTECEALLEENKGYHVEAGQRSTPLKNLQFVFTQQEQRADDLRRRLHFHTEKIRFVIDRLQLDLLTDLDAKVDDILGLAERNIHLTEGVLFEILRFRQDLVGFPLGQTLTRDLVSDDLHIASDAIAARFRRSMVVEGLSTTMTGMPLARSFDALLTHFQQSYDGGDQTPEKYLLFLKARWLLGLIKESQEYKDARPGWYFKRAVNQIDHAILTRSRRPQEMLAFDEPVLMSLPEPQFQVWLAPAEIARDQGTRRPYEQWGRRPDEREVAQIELDCGEDQSTSNTVTVFKSTDADFRIVQVLRQPNERVIIPQQVNSSEHKLIPRYALPTLRIRPERGKSIHLQISGRPTQIPDGSDRLRRIVRP